MEIKRRTEVYKVLLEKKFNEPNSSNYNYEELTEIKILEDVLSCYYKEFVHTTTNDKKCTLNSNNICYYMSKVIQEDKIRKVKLNYIKFNKNTQVVDIDSLKSNYKKGKKEGDEEYQHYVIKTYEDTNRAVLVFEKISGAVTIGMLTKNINKCYKEWVKNTYKLEDEHSIKMKTFLLQYEIKIKIVPSPDFVKELESLEKISLLRVTVNKENVTLDEDLNFSEESVCRDEVDLIYKPIQTLSFSKTKMKNYYELFENQTGNTKIKRLVIGGRKEGNSISLDTEQMKLVKYINAKIDQQGFIDDEKLFDEYQKLIDNNFKEYFNSLFIEEDESEE